MVHDQILDSGLAGKHGAEISDLGRKHLLEAAKWGRFLGIFGFVLIGLFLLLAVVMGIAMGVMMGSSGSGLGAMYSIGMSVMYILLAGIYLYPTLKLYQFSSKALSAIPSGNTLELTAAFESLKSMFKFMGIFTVVIFVFYFIIIVIAAIAGAMQGM